MICIANPPEPYVEPKGRWWRFMCWCVRHGRLLNALYFAALFGGGAASILTGIKQLAWIWIPLVPTFWPRLWYVCGSLERYLEVKRYNEQVRRCK